MHKGQGLSFSLRDLYFAHRDVDKMRFGYKTQLDGEIGDQKCGSRYCPPKAQLLPMNQEDSRHVSVAAEKRLRHYIVPANTFFPKPIVAFWPISTNCSAAKFWSLLAAQRTSGAATVRKPRSRLTRPRRQHSRLVASQDGG